MPLHITPPKLIALHPYYSKTDYEFLSIVKGLTDDQIADQWTLEFAELSQYHQNDQGYIPIHF